MDREELLGRYAAGERDFTGVDLKRDDLIDINLAGICLRGATFYQVNLTNVYIYYLSNLSIRSSIYYRGGH